VFGAEASRFTGFGILKPRGTKPTVREVDYRAGLGGRQRRAANFGIVQNRLRCFMECKTDFVKALWHGAKDVTKAVRNGIKEAGYKRWNPLKEAEEAGKYSDHCRSDTH
jgi:site-specific DNA-cytosine methylase